MIPWEIAITTRWMDGPHAIERARRAIDLGLSSVVVHGDLREREWAEIAAFLPHRAAVAISLFAPLPRTVRVGEKSPFHIGSLHPEERRDADNQAVRTLEMADQVGAAVVLVPPAVLEVPSMDEVVPLLGTEKRPQIWEALRRKRAGAAQRELASYLITLNRLLDRADRYGLILALVPGGLPSELPDLEEAKTCLTEFTGAPLYLWPDLLNESRIRRTAGPDPSRLRTELGGRVLGIGAEDSDGERRHLPLGSGEVDLESWQWLREAEPPRALTADEGKPSAESGAAAGRSPTPGPGRAPGLSAAEAIRTSPHAPPIRVAAIDLASDLEEEAVLETREALKKLLTLPQKEFDLFTR